MSLNNQDAIEAALRIFLYHHGTGIQLSGAIVKREKELDQLRIVYDIDTDIFTMTLISPIVTLRKC